MSATSRKLEFSLEWIEEDENTQTARLMPTSSRAKAWLDQHGMPAVLARADASGREGQPLHEILQDLLEEDADIVGTERAPTADFEPSTCGEFSVSFEDDPAGSNRKVATVTGLTERARGWIKFQGESLRLRVSKERRPGERLDVVHQRLLEQDLGNAVHV
ncbi:MAG: hypothetical protein Q7T97_18250 [Burkholderiaceae bacterium]|nr:hypothetical protein [Burkholderiaceae bacterium]